MEPDKGDRAPRPAVRRSRSRLANPSLTPINALGLIASLFGLAGAAAYGSGQAEWGAALAVLGVASASIGLCWSLIACRAAVVSPFVGFLFCGTITVLALTVSRSAAPVLAGAATGLSLPGRNQGRDSRPAAAAASHRQGDFLVEVVSARLGHPKVRDLYSQDVFDWKSPALIVSIEIRNLGTTQVAEYRSGPCQITDNFGNSYHELNLGTACLVERVAGVRHLNPGKSLNDLLVFDPPVDKAKSFNLELSGETVGISAPFQCRIPAPLRTGDDPESMADQSAP